MTADELTARIGSARAAIVALSKFHTMQSEKAAQVDRFRVSANHAARADALQDAAAIVDNIAADWELPEPSNDDYLKTAAATLGVSLRDCYHGDCGDCAGCRV